MVGLSEAPITPERLQEIRLAGQPAVVPFAAAGLPPPVSLAALHALFARVEPMRQQSRETRSARDIGNWLAHIRDDRPFDEAGVIPVAQQITAEAAATLGVAKPALLAGIALQPPRLWLGVSSYHTPAHADDADNFIFMLSGAKLLRCSPPASSSALRPRCVAEQCWASVDWAEAGQASTNVTVRAGQVLFLPRGWFHRVTNLGPTVMVNLWTDEGRDEYVVRPDSGEHTHA